MARQKKNENRRNQQRREYDQQQTRHQQLQHRAHRRENDGTVFRHPGTRTENHVGVKAY